MMNIRNVLIILFSILVIMACEKENKTVIDESNLLMGNWINANINDTISTFQRVQALPDSSYSFSFKQGYEFSERKNAGWCGTPPITYADFDGTWSANDSIINITVEFWGGMNNYKWKLISVDENHLVIYWLENQVNWKE